MITGGELIVFIIENDLVDKPLFEDGKLLGFVTEEEVAVKMGVGVSTVRVWVNQELIDGIRIVDTLYIPANYEPKLRKALEERKLTSLVKKEEPC